MRLTVHVLLLAGTLLGAGEQPLTIAALGDSITGDRPGKAYRHLYTKWIDLVGMGAEVRAGVGAVRVINAGFAGDTSHGSPSGDPPGAIKRLQAQVIDAKADICVMLIGGNDFARLRKLPAAERASAAGPIRDTLKADLLDMVGRCQAAGIKVLLVQYHAARAADPAKAWDTLDDGNEVIAAVATERQVPCLALEPAFAAAIAAGAKPEEMLTPEDGVHLRPYGEIIVARTVLAKLIELGWIPAKP